MLKKSSPCRIIYTSSILAFASHNLDPKSLKNGPKPPHSLLNDILVSPYSDTKLCLAILGHLLAKELKGTGISVYPHYPGLIHTDLFQKACQDDFSVPLYVYKFIATLFGSVSDSR